MAYSLQTRLWVVQIAPYYRFLWEQQGRESWGGHRRGIFWSCSLERARGRGDLVSRLDDEVIISSFYSIESRIFTTTGETVPRNEARMNSLFAIVALESALLASGASFWVGRARSLKELSRYNLKTSRQRRWIWRRTPRWRMCRNL